MIGRTRKLLLSSATLAGLAVALAAAGGGGAAPAPIGLLIQPQTVAFGSGPITLSGVVPNRRAGQVVSILAQPCKITQPAELTKVRTKAGGAFRFRIEAMVNTTFLVRSGSASSRKVRVQVQPKVVLSRVGPGRYSADVSTTNPLFLDGKRVLFQRLSGKRWVTVQQVTLKKNSREDAMIAVSSATFTARVPRGTPVRLFLPQLQAPCYRAAASAVLP